MLLGTWRSTQSVFKQPLTSPSRKAGRSNTSRSCKTMLYTAVSVANPTCHRVRCDGYREVATTVKKHVPPHASLTCHTRNFSSRVHVAQEHRGSVRLRTGSLDSSSCEPESHSISSMFHRILLDPQLSPHFYTPFPSLALGLSTSLSL